MERFDAIVFDAFGTLFDTVSVNQVFDGFYPGYGQQLGTWWEAKQFEHAWGLMLMGRYVDFSEISAIAAIAACRQLGLTPTDHLLHALRTMSGSFPPYPDVVPAVFTLRHAGFRLLILSNGTPSQLTQLVANANLQHQFEVLSVDPARAYKPSPYAYQVVENHTDLPASGCLFVSAHEWDIAGAGTYGFTTAWVNRKNHVFEHLGGEPNWSGGSLTELAGQLAGLLSTPR